MVMFLDANNDLRIIETSRVRFGSLRKTKHAASVGLESLPEAVTLSAQIANLEPRPLPPEVYPGCNLNQVRNERPSNPSRDFKEIEAAIGMRADVFGVSDAAHHA